MTVYKIPLPKPDINCRYAIKDIFSTYEVNNKLIGEIEKAGLTISGRSNDGSLVEMVEISDHPWFVACQFHPEFTSTPRDGHPLFESFINAAKEAHNLILS